MVDFLVWYLILLVAGIVALPLAQRFLSNLPDRGYTLSKPLGLLLWGFTFWLLTSLGLLQNSTGGVLLALLLVVAAAIVLGGGLQGVKEAFFDLMNRRLFIIVSETLFLSAFILWAIVRAANPQVSGTEKPMELAFINAILRSPTFPPSDPWLSGYAISYYYFGYVIVSMLVRVAGVASGVGFNLAVASWFALVALAAYGVVFNLLTVAHRNSGNNEDHHSPAIWQALAAPVLMLIVSNLGGLLEVLHASGTFWQRSAVGYTSDFWNWLKLPELTNPPTEPLGWTPERLGGIWWWRASRVVQDFDISGGWREVIDEFPFFSYYLADLHPHVLSMPFALLAVGWAFNLYLKGEKLTFRLLRLGLWIRQPDFWLTAIILGGLSFLNTWDFPIYLGLFCVVFVLVRYRQEGLNLWPLARDLVGLMVALGAAGIALYLPFYIGFASQAGGILPSLAFFTRGIYFWIMFAPLLVSIGVWLFWRWRQKTGGYSIRPGVKVSLYLLVILFVFSYGLAGLALALPGLGQSLLASNQYSLARLGQNFIEWGGLFYGLQGSTDASQILLGSLAARLVDPGTWISLLILIAMGWGIISHFFPSEVTQQDADEDEAQPKLMPAVAPDGFVALLILVGAALTLAVEFVYLRDQFGTRMNTIFKFYFQTWMVWALSAAYSSVMVWRGLRSMWGWLARVVCVVVFACGLIYPVFGLSNTLGSGDSDRWTLDGNAWFGVYYPDEQQAVEWLAKASYGTIAEAVGGSYSGAARFATYTGLPTVLGWPGHESQWRGGGKEMGNRQDDLARLYRTSNWAEAQAIISQYQIRYIVVGGLERSTYKVVEPKFQANLTKVFQSGSVVIYGVP